MPRKGISHSREHEQSGEAAHARLIENIIDGDKENNYKTFADEAQEVNPELEELLELKKERLLKKRSGFYDLVHSVVNKVCALLKIKREKKAPTQYSEHINRIKAGMRDYFIASMPPFLILCVIVYTLRDNNFWNARSERRPQEAAVIWLLGGGLLMSLMYNMNKRIPNRERYLSYVDNLLDMLVMIVTIWYMSSQSGTMSIILNFTSFQFLGSLNDDVMDTIFLNIEVACEEMEKADVETKNLFFKELYKLIYSEAACCTLYLLNVFLFALAIAMLVYV